MTATAVDRWKQSGCIKGWCIDVDGEIVSYLSDPGRVRYYGFAWTVEIWGLAIYNGHLLNHLICAARKQGWRGVEINAFRPATPDGTPDHTPC